MNKKGFTLVELLAVIVILAVVMLIGGTTVLPMMQKAQKQSLGTEGMSLVKAAQNAYQTEIIKGANANFNSTNSVCFSMEYLCNAGYFDKGCAGEKVGTLGPKDDGDKYTGSVSIKYDDGEYTYKFWISNGTYVFGSVGGVLGEGSKKEVGNVDDPNVVKNGDIASTTCGMTSRTNLNNNGYVYCGAGQECS